MNLITIELLDKNGVVVDQWRTTAAENLESLILEAAETSGAYDDERYGGTGDVCEGSIRWKVGNDSTGPAPTDDGDET